MARMIASLPMYDRPETAGANDRLWAGILSSLHQQNFTSYVDFKRDVEGLDHWLDPSLLMSQTCGMPYRLHLHDKVHLVGTPISTLDDPDGYYHSVLVAHVDDPRDQFEQFKTAQLACNMGISQSGWAAPQNMALDCGFSFENVRVTGGHHASAKAVSDQAADIAAIDVITWQFIQRYDAWAQKLKVIAKTPSTPTLPYITSHSDYVAPLFSAYRNAIAALSEDDRRTLCLRGITKIPAEDYLAVPSPAFPKVTPD